MNSRWDDIDAALQTRGFVSVPSPLDHLTSTSRYTVAPSDRWYFGRVQAKRGPASLYLAVSDLEFIRAPSVWLEERPVWLQGWRPHLIRVAGMTREWLCYSDHESYQLLSHNPARAVLRVLEDATITLDRIAAPETVKADSMREISILWHSSGDQIYCDVEPSNNTRIYSVGTSQHEGTIIHLISEQPSALAKKLHITPPSDSGKRAAVYPEPVEPLYITPIGPPQDLAQLRRWLLDTSPETHAEWRAMMKSSEQYMRNVCFHFFRTRCELVGFLMRPDKPLGDVRGARSIRAFIERQVHRRPAPIIRLSATRLDNTYLVRRNLPADTPDFRGLKILMVGCGTIGGYLGLSLVQLGAGISKESIPGTLSLCDIQTLTQQNVGRHALGMNWLNKNKAFALAEEIKLQRYGVQVASIQESVFSLTDRLNEFDIIINATGYEPIGRALSKTLRAQSWFNGSNCLMHTWVEGRGGVTRCLVEDSLKSACFDCMWTYSPNIEPRPRYEPYGTSDWYARVGDGYASMTPFSVSASHAATSLAIDAILAWRAGNPTPRFRSRSAEGKEIRPSVSCNLTPIKNCPLCSILS